MKKWVFLTCAILFDMAGAIRYRQYWMGQLTGSASAWVLLVGAVVLFAVFFWNIVKDHRYCHSAGLSGVDSDRKRGEEK